MEKNINSPVTLKVEIKDLDLYIEKAKEYVQLLTEAKSLAEELASVNFDVKVTT